MKFSLIAIIALLAISCKKGNNTPVDPIINDPVETQNWVDHSANPIVVKGVATWEISQVMSPWIIRSGSSYKMWYTGAARHQADLSIGYATSPDGINWTRHPGNPVLKLRAGDFDEQGVFAPVVIQDNDSLKMWYGAGSNPDRAQIGYASSIDGIVWIRRQSSVLQTSPFGEWYSDALIPGSVIKDGNIFKMWFSGSVGSIAGATSGTKTGIGYATSPDGISWTVYDNPATTASPYKNSDPVLNYGSTGSWDANEMFKPCVLKTDYGYELWYSGWAPNLGQHIGYASSTDGITWKKHPYNPLFRSPTWAIGIVFPSVLWDGGNKYRMWYHAWINGGSSFGYATMTK